MINLWIAFSEQAITEFKDKRDSTSYSGPMDDRTFKIMFTMQKSDQVQRLFKETPPIGGKKYKLFSIYTDNDKAVSAVDYITSKWSAHIIVLGAWEWDTGLQLGLSWIDDADHSQGTTGTETYPLHAQSWRIMPDLVTYDDEDGVEASRTPAASNSDLRDVNLLYGQSPRRFA